MNNSRYFPEITEELLQSVFLHEEDMISIKRLKTVLVKSQLYAEAGFLRDLEKRMTEILDAMIIHGLKPNPIPESEEKVYSINDVTHMLNLATIPLKDTIRHYEELSRTTITDHVARLMKEIDELRKNQKDAPST